MANSPLVNLDALNTVYEAICNQFKEKVYTTTANPYEILGTSSLHYSQAYIDDIIGKNWYIDTTGEASFNSHMTVKGNMTIGGSSINITNTSSLTKLSGRFQVEGHVDLNHDVTFAANRIITIETGGRLKFADATNYYNDVKEAASAADSDLAVTTINQLASAQWVRLYCGAALDVLEQQINNQINSSIKPRLSALENDISENINPSIENLNLSVFGNKAPTEAVAESGKIINSSTRDASANSTDAAIYTPGGLKVGLNIYAGAVHNAVWNDLADCIPVPEDTELEYGYCYKFDGENYTKTSNYSDSQFIGIHSDTAGFYMGERPTKTLKASVAGFVLAHVDKLYKPGTLLTCAKDGKLTKANLFTRLFKPHSIIASFWKDETEEEWGPKNRKIKVNGRKWVKIK